MNVSKIKTLVILLVCMFVFSANMQATAGEPTHKFKYQGEGEIFLQAGSHEISEMGINIINGVRLNRYLYTGVGIGVSTSLDDEALMMPLFLDVKGYLPISRKISFLAVGDLGIKTDFSVSGFYVNPGMGISLKTGRKCALNITLRYEYFTYNENFETQLGNIGARIKCNNIGLKLGLSF